MGQYDLFRKLAQSSLTNSEREINTIKYDLLSEFENSPSYHITLRNNISQGFHIIDENALNKNPNKKRILCKPDEIISVGDYIYWKDVNWLCTNIDSDDTVQNKGIIQRCNNIITLVKNNITYNIPCCVEGSVQLYRLRLEENKYLSNVDDNIIIRVPNNSTTILMNVNDVYKIGKWNYKLTNISDVVEPGLLILKFEIVFDEQELPTYTISILNGESLQIAQSQSLTLNVGVYEDGELLTTSPPYSFVSSDETIATVNNSGEITFLSIGNVNITVNLDSSTEIQDTIAIEVIETETDNITYKIIGEDEIINEYSENYLVQKLNNGSVVSGTFTFSVVDGTATVNDYILSVIDENNVNITAKNKNVSIILRAIDSSDITKYIDKTIKFVSLF